MGQQANRKKQRGASGIEAAVLMALVVVLAMAGVRAAGTGTLARLAGVNAALLYECPVKPQGEGGPGETGGSRGTC